MWFLRFLKSNIIYILWFVVYFTIAWFIFGANLTSFKIVSVVYGISMSIALSPVGEVILRFSEGCRLPATEQEKNYLLPLFEEVYKSAKQVNPSLNNGIKLYIMDAMYVNAFAIGRTTIAVTRGAVETFNSDELKGILAHELGHMTYGHTKALLLSNIGNFMFTVIVWISRLLLKIAQFFAELTARMNVAGLALWIIAFMAKIYVEVIVFLFINLSEMLLSLNSRANEYEADKFSYVIGFGKELRAGLYILQKITMNTKVSFSERLKSTHPHTADRIARLEQLESQENRD